MTEKCVGDDDENDAADHRAVWIHDTRGTGLCVQAALAADGATSMPNTKDLTAPPRGSHNSRRTAIDEKK